MLYHAAPAMLDSYFASATDQDHFMVGPSGAGYMNPGAWASASLDTYTQSTANYMAMTGMETIYVLNRTQGQGVMMTEAAVASYQTQCNLLGIMLNWEIWPDSRLVGDGIPQSVVVNAGTMENITRLEDVVRPMYDGSTPMFGAVGVLAWDVTPSDLAAWAATLDESIVLVRGDQYFELMRQWANLGNATFN